MREQISLVGAKVLEPREISDQFLRPCSDIGEFKWTSKII
jgi:hypothetical protein